MFTLSRRNKFKVRIVYDNGYTHDFWVYNWIQEDGIFKWESIHDHNRPIQLGVSNVISVWQIGYRRSIWPKSLQH